jgi:hypothetical protein
MFIVVDASVWVARLVSQDVFYEPVKEWMAAHIESNDHFLRPRFCLPNWVVRSVVVQHPLWV